MFCRDNWCQIKMSKAMSDLQSGVRWMIFEYFYRLVPLDGEGMSPQPHILWVRASCRCGGGMSIISMSLFQEPLLLEPSITSQFSLPWYSVHGNVRSLSSCYGEELLQSQPTTFACMLLPTSSIHVPVTKPLGFITMAFQWLSKERSECCLVGVPAGHQSRLFRDYMWNACDAL